MNKALITLTAIALTLTSYGQGNAKKGETIDNKTFKYPVLVKLIQGSGNVFRIGFVRYSDYYGIEENANDPKNIYASFIDLVEVSKGDFKNKCFVYFPLSKNNGETLIIDRNDVAKLDMRYEQAIELIVVNTTD